MVVDRGISNPLIAEGLLKNSEGLDPPFFPKSLTNSYLWNGRTIKSYNYFSSEIITD